MERKCSLLIRADANTRIGTGHLMRCLALAQAWQDAGGESIFITSCESTELLERLENEGFNAIQMAKSYPDPSDWRATSEVLAEYPNAWVVLDGYHFDSAYQMRIKHAGHQLLVIDDMAHLEHYHADIVLNQNLHAEQLKYPCDPHTQLLLGTQYVLLRREFLKWQDWRREFPEVAGKVLVTLGGSDPDNVTLKVINAIVSLGVEDLDVRVIVGPSNPHRASLEEAASHLPSTIHLLPSAEDMPSLMAWADVAVSAAGSTCWELGFMGLPSILLVLACNQQDIGAELSNVGVAQNLGWFEQVTDVQIAASLSTLLAQRRKRKLVSQGGRRLVDGMGTEAVLEKLRRSERR